MADKEGRKDLNIEFPPDDKITRFSYQLVEDLFEVEGPLLTNESSLHDFDDIDYIPGHWSRRLTNIPGEERSLYEDKDIELIDPESYYVWYPKVSEEEWMEINKASRERFFKRIETTYLIPMTGYAGDDRLYIWEVAQFIEQRLKFT